MRKLPKLEGHYWLRLRMWFKDIQRTYRAYKEERYQTAKWFGDL